MKKLYEIKYANEKSKITKKGYTGVVATYVVATSASEALDRVTQERQIVALASVLPVMDNPDIIL